MFLETIMVIAVLYVLYVQHCMHQEPELEGVFDTCSADCVDDSVLDAVPQLIVPIPTEVIPAPTPTVSAISSTDESTTLTVTPVWYEPVKLPPASRIRWPTHYERDSPTDVRLYECLAAYRSMNNKHQPIDFVGQPFAPAVSNTETAVVVLNELAKQLGARLSFTEATFQYDDSAYRTACGVGNLGSIHSMLAAGANVQTAKFKLHMQLDYDAITSTPKTLKDFTLTLINDLAATAGCSKEYIRVFSVSRASSIHVHWGVTTPEFDATKKIAETLKQKLSLFSVYQRHDILDYLIPEPYDYKWGAAISLLQLQESDFETRYNRDYPHAQEERRGGRPYYFPQGWYRHALKVEDKYPNDQAWLGMSNSPGEWSVAYHGTKAKTVRGITDTGLEHKFVTTDVCKDETKSRRPPIPDVKGLYVATHCEGGASGYIGNGFKINDPQGISKTYHVVFQCRVENGKFTEHKGPVKIGLALRVFDEKAIRPYGLLLKVK